MYNGDNYIAMIIIIENTESRFSCLGSAYLLCMASHATNDHSEQNSINEQFELEYYSNKTFGINELYGKMLPGIDRVL